jgi:hypothetical protein
VPKARLRASSTRYGTASRSMRVRKRSAAAPTRRDARTRAPRAPRERCQRALRVRAELACRRAFPIHDVKQRSLLRSRGALLRPGWFFTFAPAPNEGWAERRQARYVVSHAYRGGARPTAAGRSPLGAPPWRFWAGVRASISGISSGSVQRAPRSQVVMPGGRGPGPPEPDGYEPSAAGRHSCAPPSGSSLEDAPHERGWRVCIMDAGSSP